MLHSLKATATRAVLLAIPLLGSWPLPAQAQTAYQVKDINTTETPLFLGAHNLASVGSRVFFVGEGPTSGKEIWVTDGTSGGTRLVTDLRPGNRNQPGPEKLTDVNGRLFFTLDWGELWKSDGTAAGTVRLKVIDSSSLGQLTNVNGVLYFIAQDSLWRSDGTEEGTGVVKTLAAWNLTNVNGTLYFDGSDSTGSGLFESDGTEQGTRLVAPVSINTNISFAAQGDRVYFAARQGGPWVSDGTLLGTRPVAPAEPGVAFSDTLDLEVVGNTLFFAAKESPNAAATLWRTDGTSANTVRVSTVEPQNLTGSGTGLLYFLGTDVASGQELWVSDGTSQGTHIVKDTCPGNCGITPRAASLFDAPLPAANGLVYFRGARNDAGEIPLWRSDGSAQGTYVLVSAAEAPFTYADLHFVRNGPWMFFAGLLAPYGDLVRTDGTVAGTTAVYDIRVGGSSLPDELTPVGDKLYFTAAEPSTGREVWSTDGSLDGTAVAADISPGEYDSVHYDFPLRGAAFQGALLFGATRVVGGAIADWGLWRTNGSEGATIRLGQYPSSAPEVVGQVAYYSGPGLFRTDGTPQGTVLVNQFGFGVNELANVDETLYFTTPEGLFRLDGSPQGWRQLTTSANARALLSLKGRAYFRVDSGLWESDGTSGGTRAVRDVLGRAVGPEGNDSLVKAGNRFFFVNTNGLDGEPALWRSDGTPAGTFVVKTITAYGLTDSHGVLFFYDADWTLYGPGHGLWKSDGTVAGTVLVKDLQAVSDLIDIDGTLYFAAYDPEHGRELWKSDGTPEGTVLVYDVAPGPTSSNPQGFARAGGLVYFSADDGTTGSELWAFPVPPSAVAAMVSPAPSSRLPGATSTFTWAPGANASEYWLTVGTTFSGGEILSASQGRNLSKVVTRLPVDGSTVYVRLWTLFGGSWRSVDYTYLAAVPRPATMVTPVPGAALNSAVVTFNWEAGVGATAYWLFVGTTPAGVQIYPGSQVTNLSATVSGVPTTGAPVYVRLFSLIGGRWQHIDYSYTTGGPAVSLTVSATTVQPGQTVQVTLQGGPGNLRDWVALHSSTAVDTSYLDWRYLNGTKTAPATPLTSATLTFTMPTAAGTYNFRFFQNGVFTKLATSPTVTVGAVSNPVLNVTPTSLAFGNVPVGTTLDKTVVVKNTGGGTLAGTGSVTGTGYSIVGTASYSLTANQEMTLTVRFAPTAGGSASGTLTLTGGAGATVPLTGNGTTAGPSLTIVGGATTVVPGATVQVQVTNGPGAIKDWVALHTTGAADNVYLDWKYLNGTRTAPVAGLTSATLTFTMPTAVGAYQFRFFANDTFTRLSTSATVTVAAASPTLTVSTTTATPGQSIQVTVQNGPGFTKDWLGLHATTAVDTAYLDWKYLNGTRTAPATPLTSATVTFTMPTTPGTYNFRFFQNGVFTKLATSTAVTVAAASNPVLGVNPTSLTFGDVAVGQTLDKTVTVTNTGGGTLTGTGAVTGTGYTIVGAATYALTASQQATLTVRFAPTATGATSGALTLTGGAGATVPLAGNGVGPSLTFVGGVTTVAPGAVVQVQVSNGPGFTRDWVGLHATTAADTVYLDWKYLNGTRTAPATPLTTATLMFTMPTAPGTYQFRFFQNGGYNRLATSTTVTVH